MARPGQFVELGQLGRKGQPYWVPLLVTELHDPDTVSGVAFFGRPSLIGWSRPTRDFAHIKRGSDVTTGEVGVSKSE